MKAGPERELLQRYLSRAQAGARNLGFSAISEIEVEEGRARQADQRKDEEAAALLAKVPPGTRLLLLDERGRPLSSVELARTVERARDAGEPAFCLAIGGPDGFSPALLKAHDTLAFGAATFPHQLVRVLAAEQLYRITTILAGHPYHRA